MLRKFRNAVTAGILAATLVACVTTGLKPGDIPPMSRAEATALKAPIYSVDIAAASGPAAKKALSDAFMKIYNNTPTDTRYGNPRIIEDTDRGFRIRSNRAPGSVSAVQPPDVEIAFFLEEIPGQPAQLRANTYFVAIQNPGTDERRFSYDNVALMNEDGNKRMMDQILPRMQQQFSGSGVTVVPTPPSGAVSVMPSRTAEMTQLEKLFLAGDADGMRQQARRMAASGSSVAQCALAYADFMGVGGTKDAVSGQRWLDQALAANDVVCKAAADLYGWGRPQNMASAVTALRISAEAGNVHALYILGWVAQGQSRNADVGGQGRAWLVTSAQLWSAAIRLGLDSIQPQLDAVLKTLNDEERGRVNSYASRWWKA